MAVFQNSDCRLAYSSFTTPAEAEVCAISKRQIGIEAPVEVKTGGTAVVLDWR
jgi:hypothetical protein